MEDKAGDLKVWHIPQVPMKQFEVPVDSPEEGIKVMDILANYDTFQFDNNIKPDYCNVQGLVVLGSDGEWYEWSNENGDDIDAIRGAA
jgi:hypothetical protein